MSDVQVQSSSEPLERAVIGFARLLLTGSSEHLDAALEELLSATCADAVMVDRLEFDPMRGPLLVAQAQARRSGVPHTWIDFPLDRSLDQYEAFMAGRPWIVPDSYAADAPDREAYLALDPPIRSELCIPILIDRVAVGQLSLVFAEEAHDWSDLEIAALSAATDVIQTVWAREMSAARLQAAAAARHNAVRVTDALLACSQALLLDAGEEAVDRALREILSASGASVVYIDENVGCSERGPSMKTRFSAVSSLIPQQTFTWFDGVYAWSDLPGSRDLLSSGRVVIIESRAEMPPGDSPFYGDHNFVHAKIAAPIFVEGEWTATMGLLSAEPRPWMPEHRRLVEAVAAMFGAYWTREAAAARLHRALTSRDEFVASVSHELRTPLAAVVGFASELRDAYDDFDDETRLDLIALIARQAVDVGFLVDDLLVAARAQQASLSLSPSMLDIGAELRATLTGLPPEYAAGIVCEGTGAVPAFADDRRLRQIVRNLVVNARKYGGPSCSVHFRSDADCAVIEVRDDGPAISPEIQETMFDAYSSAGHGGEALPSMGLGLTVSRRLAETMGGSLTYRFDGSGVFSLLLPGVSDSIDRHRSIVDLAERAQEGDGRAPPSEPSAPR